jgi:cell wall-associated NlpC family hydrolase
VSTTTTTLAPGLLPPTDTFAWPTIDLDVALLLTLSERTTKDGNQYRLGGKAPSLDADSATIGRIGIDCSGYVRWILHRATGNRLVIPDGSWHQAEWAEATGLKTSTILAGSATDGRVRLAYMKPLSQGGVGHIALIHNARTIESSGKRGPGRRPWDGNGWQKRCRLWVLT